MYKCECGSIFDSAQKFNSHKRACEQHMLVKYGSLDKFNEIKANSRKTIEIARATHSERAAQRKQQKINEWIAAQHSCERCGRVMIEKFGSGRFCSRACANAREHSIETRSKICNSLSGVLPINKALATQARTQRLQEAYYLNPAFCRVCGIALPFEQRFRKTCSDTCYHKALQNGGKVSASQQCKRSQNEIIFCNLCEEYFGKDRVLHNEPVFNGWDADIILLDYKLAILWNGPWHYRKVLEGHSLEQVQNRDKIKVAEIEKAGYAVYIINDSANKRMSEQQVCEEFSNLLGYLKLNNYIAGGPVPNWVS